MVTVSVIMSVHNNKKYVGDAVQSVLDQDYSDFEFIIYDDGSTDGTFDVLKSFNDERIILKRNKKSIGLTKTLNKMLSMARGKYIARMDGDDICEVTRFSKQVKMLESSDVCGTWITLIAEDGEQIVERKYSGNIDKSILIASPLAHPSVMFRKSLVDEYKGYDEDFVSGQDYDLWLRYWSAGARFSVVQESLLKYRIHTESVKSKNTRAVLRNTLRIKRKARTEYDVRFGFFGWLRIGMERVASLLPSRLVLWAWRKTL